MAEETRTFSEMWYRVAKQVITLRPRVAVRRQVFRGERWHVLHDPFNNQFFRLQPDAYAFVARLRADRTVEQVWQETVEADPDAAPGQEEVIQLLAQLYHANLLHYRLTADSEQFFARYKKRRQRERMFTWWNLMFARFPLFDPDAWLNAMQPVTRVLMSRWAAIVWLVVVVLGIKTCVDHAGELGAQVAGVLEPSNLLLLYVGVLFLKLLHEFGHAAACKYFGGEVHTLGVMLLVFSPLPYVDVTASWTFRERWKRIAVASAGMVAEFFVAAIAALAWAAAGPGVVRDLAFNMMLAAGVTTLVFNANPLLRYDGYYILSDLADLPNLYQRGQQMLLHLAQRYLFGVRRGSAPFASSKRERIWLVSYGGASLVYRLLVFAGLVWFVSGRFLLLGMIVAVFCAFAWGIVPLAKFANYLATSPQLDRTRPRAIGVSVGIAVAAAFLLGALPVPQTLRAPGVIRPVMVGDVATGVAGEFETLEVASGERVTAGQPLARLRNRELALELASARAQQRELQGLWREALRAGNSSRTALEQGLEAVEARVRMLEEQEAKLMVTAPLAGVWVAPGIEQARGSWMKRGTALGQIFEPEQGFEFSAIVPQVDASRFFTGEIGEAVVRVRGQSTTPLEVGSVVPIQAEQNRLPSAALAQNAGGEVALAREGGDRMVTAETFYEVRAKLRPNPEAVLFSGLTGRIAFDLPAEPLGWQWARALRQAFQKRAAN